jgi:hypothetical protein
MSSANLRINRPVGFLPYVFKPAFQSSAPSAAGTPRPIRSDAVVFRGLDEFAMSQIPQSEIIEDALRKQVKLLPNDKL